MARAYLALGSNLGDRATALERAAAGLGALPGTAVVARSPVYETAPVGGEPGQGMFLNGVVALETALEPAPLLAAAQRIEREAGRPAAAARQRWGPRVLDVDLLLYEDRVIDEPGLRVPHPRMHERWFVLRPLADVAADRVHPVLKRTIASLLAAVERRGTPEATG